MSDPFQRDFVAPLQHGHRTRGAAASKKANEPAAVVDWDAAIASLKRLLRRQYAKGGMAGPELEHQRLDGQEATE